MPDAWSARNCRHVGDVRRGAGPSLAAARVRQTVPAPTGTPAEQLALDAPVTPAAEMLSSTFPHLCGAGDYVESGG
jgi:hypothetical protein